jgi:hypothetical protein
MKSIKDNFKKIIPKFKKTLSHPMILLIFGAIISGLLVPYITNQWQNHQKELELKIDIVSQISKAVTNIIVASRIIQIPAFSSTNLTYANTFEEWEVSKATIGSQVQAYFPKYSIKQEWDNLSLAITEFSGLSPQLTDTHISKSDYAIKVCARMNHILNLHEYLDSNYPININSTDLNMYDCQGIANQQDSKYSPNIYNINWKVLLYKNKYSSSIYFKNWLMLEKELQTRKDNLIKTILDTPMLIF